MVFVLDSNGNWDEIGTGNLTFQNQSTERPAKNFKMEIELPGDNFICQKTNKFVLVRSEETESKIEHKLSKKLSKGWNGMAVLYTRLDAKNLYEREGGKLPSKSFV